MAVSRTLLRVGPTSDSLVWIPDPSELQWGIQSVSDSDAGRDMKGKMHVNLVTRKRKIELKWNGVDFATAAEILQAFNPETFYVDYLDAQTNTRPNPVKQFYVGDRTAMVNSYADGYRWYTTVAFNIIEV